MSESLSSNGAGAPTSAEAWELARRYATQLGEIPSSFSSCIRSMLADYQKTGELGKGAKFLISRLLKGASILGPTYYFAKTIRASEIAEKERVTADDLLKMFNPHDLACVVGLLYLFRKTQRMCDKPGWDELKQRMIEDVEYGALVGEAIPSIGAGNGILTGGMRSLALAMFLVHDEEGFSSYRRHCKKAGLFFDLALEQERWGCNHVEVASVILQSAGFGVTLAQTFTVGMLCDDPEGRGLPQDQARFKVCSLWMDILRNTGKPPEITHQGAFYPMQEALDRMEPAVVTLRENGSAFNWLEKGPDDVSPELTPQLSTAAKRESSKPESSPSSEDDPGKQLLEYDKLPDEFKQHFPKDEFNDIVAEVQLLIEG